MKRKFKTIKPLVSDAGVYLISCIGTDKVYIGESLNLSARIVKHFSRLRKNKHINPILQNIFNKYGEDKFEVDVLEYSNFDNSLSKEEKIKRLKVSEENYQKLYGKRCISMDSNKHIWENLTSESKKESNKKQLDTIRKSAIEVCSTKIVIYDLETKTLIKLNSIEEGKKYIESKHIRRNIRDKVYLPYNGRYVAFLPDEFDINKILITHCKSRASISGVYKLYNLNTGEIINFSSKTQFSLYFSNSKNDKLYDKYLTFIDENFLTAKDIKSMSDFWNSDLVIQRSNRSIKVCNVKTYLNALKSYKTNIEFSEKMGIDRHTVTKMLSEKSISTRLKELEFTIGHLPNLFKNWETSSQNNEAINYESCE